MSDAKAITKDRFTITGIGIILELQHSENGLLKDTKLISEKSGRTWMVVARILFDHAIAEQTIFDNESVEYMLMRFESDQKRQKSINEIKERDMTMKTLYCKWKNYCLTQSCICELNTAT